MISSPAAPQLDAALMALHDLGADPQSKSGSAHSLGDKECSKQPRLPFWAHAASVIGVGGCIASIAPDLLQSDPLNRSAHP
jgi:hypothetical protein